MLLSPITEIGIEQYLFENNTSLLKIRTYMDKLWSINNDKPIWLAHDDQFTAIVAGNHIGIAKRAISSRKKDKQNLCVGISIAASRL